MLPSKRRSHIMLVNIDAEMSEILSVYPHFQNLAAPFHSVEHENWVDAQRAAVAGFVGARGMATEFTDVEGGGRADRRATP
jgi:hypothetical protein